MFGVEGYGFVVRCGKFRGPNQLEEVGDKETFLIMHEYGQI